MSRPLRILYAAGPGDVIGTFGYWKAGRDDPASVAKTYSGQFYEVCQDRNCHALVISSNKNRNRITDGLFTIQHQPHPLSGFGGAIYHLGQLWFMLRIVFAAVRFKADVIIYADGTTQWWALGFARWFGIAVVPSLHCTLWPSGRRPRGVVHRIIQSLDGRFWRKRVTANIAISPECERQALEVAGNVAGGVSRVPGPFFQARPTYPRDYFSAISPPDIGAPVFRIMYAGRVEKNKGVFELLDAAEQLQKENPGKFAWDICGGGGALESLRAETQRRNLQSVFHLHGSLKRDQMADAYGNSHVVVVPTTAGFNEGLNKVAVEGVLANRPVIVSTTVPALELLAPAAVAINADDLQQLINAVKKLAADVPFYQEKQRACEKVKGPFFDPQCSFAACVGKVMDLVGKNRP